MKLVTLFPLFLTVFLAILLGRQSTKERNWGCDEIAEELDKSGSRCFQYSSWLDGGPRALEYFELGPMNASHTILMFHGHGMSGHLVASDPSWANWTATKRVRLLAPSLPGWGLSSPDSGRPWHDWPRVMLLFLDELGVDQVSVAGVSIGGAHAAVAAADQGHLGERIVSVALFDALPPPKGDLRRRHMLPRSETTSSSLSSSSSSGGRSDVEDGALEEDEGRAAAVAAAGGRLSHSPSSLWHAFMAWSWTRDAAHFWTQPPMFNGPADAHKHLMAHYPHDYGEFMRNHDPQSSTAPSPDYLALEMVRAARWQRRGFAEAARLAHATWAPLNTAQLHYFPLSNRRRNRVFVYSLRSDYIHPESKRIWSRLLTGATYHELPGGHFTWYQEATRFQKMLNNLIPPPAPTGK